MHRVHPYPARFPASIVHNALDHARRSGISVRRVADPFCGSGTVAYEASCRGVDAWGCDINPVATLIARTKTARVDAAGFAASAARVVERSATASDSPGISETAVRELSRWYGDEQFSALARLRNAIRAEVGEGDDANALNCAFSAIAKTASQWRTRSTKPAYDPDKRPKEAVAAFSGHCRAMARAWSSREPHPAVEVRTVTGCATDLRDDVAPVDLVVTSPPYATSYEYADLHQLSALWLGLADSRRDLRRGVIGAACRRADLSVALRELNPVGIRIVFGLFDRDRAAAESVAAYLLDMQRVAERCRHLLRPGGMAVFVIGNTRLRGVQVDNSGHLARSLLEAGFDELNMVRRNLANKGNTPYRTSTGRLSAWPTPVTVYGEEHVIMARLP